MSIYNNYLIAVMNEGVTITPTHNQILIDVTTTYFKDQPFVYITHRIHSYAVDPKTYFDTSKISNLVGFAVVSKNFKAKSNAELEKIFFNKPFEIFNTLDEAIHWADTIICSY